MNHTQISNFSYSFSLICFVLGLCSCGPSEELIAVNTEAADAIEKANQSARNLAGLGLELGAAEEELDRIGAEYIGAISSHWP